MEISYVNQKKMYLMTRGEDGACATVLKIDGGHAGAQEDLADSSGIYI